MSRWLIVEDDLGAAEALAQTLLRAGCDAGIVHNGNDALSAMDDSFDGAIVDLNLPDMPGEKLVETLYERFIDKIYGFVTGVMPDEIEEIARRCGADFWLIKPIDTRELLQLIGTYSMKEAIS